MKITADTLIVGDTHIPFLKRGYLDFINDTKRKYRIKRMCHVGDIVDHHSQSFHDHDPDGMSPGDERRLALKQLAQWYKAFPHMDCAIGNHDALVQRQAFTAGLSCSFLRSFGEAYNAPRGWRWDFEWRYGNWRLTHGTGSSGHDGAFKAAVSSRISTAQGHLHTAAGVKFHASSKDILWGMQVSCGIDRRAYAYNYGRDFRDKPLIGCAVVLEGGRLPLFIPMPL